MNTKKKYILIALAIIVIVGITLAVRFYVQNLRGVRPAITDPAPKETAPPSTTPAINTTGIPFKLPNGFSISTFAPAVPGARVITFDPAGTMIVSQPKTGTVVALPDADNNGTADSNVTVINKLQGPHGLAFNCESGSCTLFIAEENQVARYDYDNKSMKASNKKKILDLPSGGGHSTRTLLLINTSAGKKLLTSIGSSCNACFEKDFRRASVIISNLDGSDWHQYANGLRNSVFMAVHPTTNKVWATENGRDLLGDDVPPDEVNILGETVGHSETSAQLNFGWPYCYGKNIKDTTIANGDCDSSSAEPSHIDLQAHSAPLGLAFIPSQVWPTEFQGDLLVAYHGSWNRRVPTGYKIMRFDLDSQGNATGSSDFITGFLKSDNKSAYGRPVDLVFNTKGDLFISDDHAGAIYKLRYNTEPNRN